MARLTVEWTFPIIHKRAARSSTSGFVNADPWTFGFSHLASDIGVGLRINLPIRPNAP